MSLNSTNIKAMVLAAGLGTRLRPLTQTTPKALLLVNGLPLITYSLRLLKKHNVRDVLINLHHLGGLIEKELGNGKKFGLKISYSYEPQVLGTGGGIKKGRSFFGNGPFLIINSDILIDINLTEFLRFHRKKKGIATMVVRPREADSQYTPITKGRNDRILHIGKNDQEADQKRKVQSVSFTGVQMLEPAFLDFIPDQREACVIREGYFPALEAGKKVFGFLYEGYWNDLGTLDRLRQAEHDLVSRKTTLSYL